MGTAGYLITNIFRVYLIYRFYNIFFTKYKINKKCVFFVYLIYYVINSIVYIQICVPVVTLAVNIVSLMAVTYIYQATFRKRMFYVMVQLGLSICTEAIAVLVSVNVMPELTSQNMEDYTMIQYFIANISCFPIVLGTEKIKRTGQGEEIPGMYWVLLLLLPVFSIYIAAVLCMLPEKYNLITGVSFVLLLLMNLIVFYLYDVLSQFMAEKIKENKIEEQNRLLNLIRSQTAGQLELIACFMKQLEETESKEVYERLLGQIVVVGTYLKRRKNFLLTLYAEAQGTLLNGEDLIQSLAESCSALKLCNIRALYYVNDQQLDLHDVDILKCYDYFEWLIEKLFNKMDMIFFRVVMLEEHLTISAHIASGYDLDKLLAGRPGTKVQKEDEKEWLVRCRIS